MKLREANRGSLRPCAIPTTRSNSQRSCRLPSAQFVTGEIMLPKFANKSSRVSNQSLGVSPLVATYCPLHSNISFGISTLAGHSKRH